MCARPLWQRQVVQTLLSQQRPGIACRSTRHTEQHLPRTLPPAYGFYFGEDDLDQLSNRVVDLINDGRLEEAETACQELKEQYPEVIDRIHRTAKHEARGETHQAIVHYERTLQHMDAHPEDFEASSREPFRDAIERLQQSSDVTS